MVHPGGAHGQAGWTDEWGGARLMAGHPRELLSPLATHQLDHGVLALHPRHAREEHGIQEREPHVCGHHSSGVPGLCLAH